MQFVEKWLSKRREKQRQQSWVKFLDLPKDTQPDAINQASMDYFGSLVGLPPGTSEEIIVEALREGLAQEMGIPGATVDEMHDIALLRLRRQLRPDLS